MAKEKLKRVTAFMAAVFAHAGHITKEEAKELANLADAEFEAVYAKAAAVAEKIMQAEGNKMEAFLEHLAKEIDEHFADHGADYGAKLFE